MNEDIEKVEADGEVAAFLLVVLQGEELMRITPEPRLVIAEGVETDEAARAFVEGVNEILTIGSSDPIVEFVPRTLSDDEAETIAHIAHEANRALCLAMDGDDSHDPWPDAPDWQRESAINGVHAIARGDVLSPQDSHANWMREKRENGWHYGEVKDAEAKTHPCMVPFAVLPYSQRAKDHLFFGIVRALLAAA